MANKTIVMEKAYEKVMYSLSNEKKVLTHNVSINKLEEDGEVEYSVYMERRMNGDLIGNSLNFYKRIGNATKKFESVCNKIETRTNPNSEKCLLHFYERLGDATKEFKQNYSKIER